MFKSIFLRKNRGQMFILATMLIAVYIVAMTVALMNLSSERYEVDHEGVREIYLDSKREIQHFVEIILSDYSKNGSIMTRNMAITMIEDFLREMEIIISTRGAASEFYFNTENFIIQANRSPFSNVTDGNIYISQIYGEFSLKITSISSTITVEESFNISFISRVEVQENKLIVEGSRGKEFSYWKVTSIYILNGTELLIPDVVTNRTGIYIFTNIPNIDNLGILSVIMLNGVHIFS